MQFQSDPTLRLTQGKVDVDGYPEAPRLQKFSDYVSLGNKEAAEESVDQGIALLSCNGQLPSWWQNKEKRGVAAVAFGFEDLELAHPDEKETMLLQAVSFVSLMAGNHRDVLVYCDRGSSRSVAVLSYYLAKSWRLTFGEALAEVMSRVEWAAPSLGMIELAVRSWTKWGGYDGGGYDE